MKKILKLFICGQSVKSKRAINNLKELCDKMFLDQYELIIIDVLEDPEAAEEEKILATPTLIKELPPPIRRIIGDLTAIDDVILGLNIDIKIKENHLG